ncbi:MAG TPA: DivIVA domain-containing protein [Streptosporangiaceae bacterium]
MRGERRLLRIGEYLIGRAARLLPGEIRDERRREWTAELPAILRDPDTRLAAHRAARMLRYAAGTVWGTALAAGGARGRLTAVMAVVVGLCTASFLAVVVTNTWRAVQAPGDWVHYYWIAAGSICLARLGWVVAPRIRRAAKPMEGVREGAVAYGAMIIPDWLLSRLLRAVGADESDLADQTGAARSPAPGPAEPAATAEQAISMARDTAGRFYRARWRPGYQAAEVDEFIARIEATLAEDARPGRVVTATDVEAVKFGTTRRGGYDEQVVDEALDHYADGLARLAPFPGPQ